MLHFTNIELKTKSYTHITIIIMLSTFDNFLGILRNPNIYIQYHEKMSSISYYYRNSFIVFH